MIPYSFNESNYEYFEHLEGVHFLFDNHKLKRVNVFVLIANLQFAGPACLSKNLQLGLDQAHLDGFPCTKDWEPVTMVHLEMPHSDSIKEYYVLMQIINKYFGSKYWNTDKIP